MSVCFLGIDIGTGSSKGVVTNIEGKILAKSTIAHELEMPKPGYYEQDADKVWWGDFTSLSLALIEQIKTEHNILPESIKAVGISSIAPCVLPVDRDGSPLRPGIMYGIDTRAAVEISEIEELVGKDKIFNMTGQDLSSQACLPKVRWIQKNEPEVWSKTAKVLTAAGYIVFKLTGRYTLDVYDAIGYAPLFNIREHRWDNSLNSIKSNLSDDGDIIKMDKLPELLWSSEVAGIVSSEASAATGLPVGTPIITGTADAASEAIGAGVCRSGDMMMMYGSSNFFIMRTETLHPIESFWASNFIDQGSSVLTGGMSTVGSLFKWFCETFPGRSLSDWEHLAAKSKPGAGGITILPYFAGERTPINAPEAKGVIFGLSLRSNPGDIYRALQESIGYGIKHNIEEMRRQGASAKRIIAIGGASESKALMQIISDITGISQFIPDVKLGACFGDAFLSAVGTGYFKDSSEAERWVGIADEIKPDRNLFKFYEDGYKKYRALYESTRHLM